MMNVVVEESIVIDVVGESVEMAVVEERRDICCCPSQL